MKSSLRVFVATVSAGAGHSQAAAALEEAWRLGRPRDTILRLDLLDSSKLAALARAAKSLGRPDAAQAVCRAVLERIEGDE